MGNHKIAADNTDLLDVEVHFVSGKKDTYKLTATDLVNLVTAFEDGDPFGLIHRNKRVVLNTVNITHLESELGEFEEDDE